MFSCCNRSRTLISAWSCSFSRCDMAAYEISLRASTSPVPFLLTLRMMPKEPWPIFSRTSYSFEGSESSMFAALAGRLRLVAMMCGDVVA